MCANNTTELNYQCVLFIYACTQGGYWSTDFVNYYICLRKNCRSWIGDFYEIYACLPKRYILQFVNSFCTEWIFNYIFLSLCFRDWGLLVAGDKKSSIYGKWWNVNLLHKCQKRCNWKHHKTNVLQFWPIITRTELQPSTVIKSSCLCWQAVNNLLKTEMQVWDFELPNWKQGIGEYAPICRNKIEQWE